MHATATPGLRSRICRLAWREPRSGDAVQRRCAIATELATLDLEPPGWPTQALLCVRDVGLRLRGGTLSATSRTVAPALRERVSILARGAARPERGRVPVEARAVCFADLAEALAAFALSACERRTAREWWWPLLWPDAAAAQWWKIWLRHAELIPAATAVLDSSGGLPIVARHISTTNARAFAQEAARAFGARQVVNAIDNVYAYDRAPGNIGQSWPDEGGQQQQRTAIAQAFRTAEQELEAIAGSSGQGASPEVRAWIAVALGLVRQPWRIRTIRFAQVLETFLTVARMPHAEHGAIPRPGDSPGAARVATPSPNQSATTTDGSDGTQRESGQAAPTHSESDERTRHEAASDEVPCNTLHRGTTSAVNPPEKPFSQEWLSPDEIVRTSFAGVFYLANVALALELYGDFTQPTHAALELPFWDFVAGLADRLSDDAAAAEALHADPVWEWLARASGRTADQPLGNAVAVPDNWRVPESWRRWMEPAGINLSEFVCAATWDEWLDEVTPWISWRLRRALGTAVGPILRQTGVIVRSRQRVEIHVALALHPLEIRVAGLDRDPGWIPAAGTDMRFIYE